MFQLVSYNNESKRAMIRCNCDRCATDYANYDIMETHQDNYFKLKDGITLTCKKCGAVHTDPIVIKENQDNGYMPHCPACNSLKTRQISTAKKAVGLAALGVFSSSFGKQRECLNCGYKF